MRSFLDLAFCRRGGLALLLAVGCGPDPAAPSAPVADAGFAQADAGAPRADAGAPRDDAGVPRPDAGVPRPDAGVPGPDAGSWPPGWCAGDCDCAAATRCVSGPSGDLAESACLPGPGQCTGRCSLPCIAGTRCVGGACVPAPCSGAACPSAYAVPVAGSYVTHYQLDVTGLGAGAGQLATVLDILGAVLGGQGPGCTVQASLETTLLCLAAEVAAAEVKAPAWVGELVTLLDQLFRLGTAPLRAAGVLTLAEQGEGLVASERWSELGVEYEGQVVDLLDGHIPGAGGPLAVTVLAFEGTRTASEVAFGPRRIEVDVDQLVVRLLDAAIVLASQGQANEVGGLLELLVCRPVLGKRSEAYPACLLAAQALAASLERSSGSGVLTIRAQRARVVDANGDRVAESLGAPDAPGTLAGELSCGLGSASFGALPGSGWYGTR
jgi:hypothetical protein